MSIVRGRDAVRGPAGVGNADVAANRSRVERLLQDPHLADGAQAGDPSALEHGNAGRIVAAVLQAPQSFHQNGNRVALRNHTDDSTHSCSVRGEKGCLVCPTGTGSPACTTQSANARLSILFANQYYIP